MIRRAVHFALPVALVGAVVVVLWFPDNTSRFAPLNTVLLLAILDELVVLGRRR